MDISHPVKNERVNKLYPEQKKINDAMYLNAKVAYDIVIKYKNRITITVHP